MHPIFRWDPLLIGIKVKSTGKPHGNCPLAILIHNTHQTVLDGNITAVAPTTTLARSVAAVTNAELQTAASTASNQRKRKLGDITALVQSAAGNFKRITSEPSLVRHVALGVKRFWSCSSSKSILSALCSFRCTPWRTLWMIFLISNRGTPIVPGCLFVCVVKSKTANGCDYSRLFSKSCMVFR